MRSEIRSNRIEILNIFESSQIVGQNEALQMRNLMSKIILQKLCEKFHFSFLTTLRICPKILLGLENKEFPTFFSNPKFFLIKIGVELGPLGNFEPFWYSRTFF